MNLRSPRFLVTLMIICILLLAGAGIWAYQATRSQNTKTSQSQDTQTGQWVHLPPGVTPTIPANGYLFKDPMGGLVLYHLPATPPSTITWAAYHNQQDGFTLDYPSNWMKIETPSNRHIGLALYPPGTNLNENVPGGPEGIGLRWATTYQPPAPADPTIIDIKYITLDGVKGQLYTRGSLGIAIIASFAYKGESFMLTTDAESDLLIYVFQHMLDSLKFM